MSNFKNMSKYEKYESVAALLTAHLRVKKNC